jgi:hypothetical protein
MDVVLKARLGVEARQVHLARRHLEMTMDEVHEPVRQVRRKVRAEVRRAILPEPAGDVHARVFLIGQLDIGIRLVVAEQDVETRLVLLDQVVFERQRFFLVIDQDVVDVARLRDQSARLDVRQLVLGEELRTRARRILALPT